jgi:(p)ppGpp synthase/HD superfamily hydrolase
MWTIHSVTFLQRAYEFAKLAHGNQLRKGTNLPYLTHLVEAAHIAESMTDDREIIAATLLHDVVEDTPYTVLDIQNEFGERVAHLVDEETQRRKPGEDKAATWHRRKEETIRRLNGASRDVQIIALSDKLSNARATYKALQEVGQQVWQRFNQKDQKEHGWYFSSVLKALSPLSGEKAYEEFKNLIQEIFHL